MDIKRYLIVGLTNLENAQKKKDEKGSRLYGEKEINEDRKKKLLKSRLELLFARLNLYDESRDIEKAIEKLESSILTYSEIYGPEHVGLTSHYFYLTEYMKMKKETEEKIINHTQNEEDKNKIKSSATYIPIEDIDILIYRIQLKIADMWRKFIVGGCNSNDNDVELYFAIGEFFIKKIENQLKSKETSELLTKFELIKNALQWIQLYQKDVNGQNVNNSGKIEVSKLERDMDKIKKEIDKKFDSYIDKEFFTQMLEIFKNFDDKEEEHY